MFDDCPDHAGGTCEPKHVREFWWPMDHCPNPDNCHNPDHPGASLDCATTEDSP